MNRLLRLRRLGAGPLTVFTLALALVVLVALDLIALPRDRASASPEAVRVARAEAVSFFSLDYRHIDAQLAVVQKAATGTFKAQYAKQAAQIRKGVVAAKLTSTATVASDGVGVEYQATGKAIVIVGVDSTTTTPATAKAKATTRTSRYRMRVTVERTSGQWLVSSIEQVG